MGRATALGLPPRKRCQNHIFETISEPLAFDCEPFFIVPTKCLVCGDTLAAIEVDSFVRATPEDWARCIDEVRSEAHRLNQLVTTLHDRAAGKKRVLRDFG